VLSEVSGDLEECSFGCVVAGFVCIEGFGFADCTAFDVFGSVGAGDALGCVSVGDLDDFGCVSVGVDDFGGAGNFDCVATFCVACVACFGCVDSFGCVVAFGCVTFGCVVAFGCVGSTDLGCADKVGCVDFVDDFVGDFVDDFVDSFDVAVTCCVVFVDGFVAGFGCVFVDVVECVDCDCVGCISEVSLLGEFFSHCCSRSSISSSNPISSTGLGPSGVMMALVGFVVLKEKNEQHKSIYPCKYITDYKM
jgi:hypothetical protein